MRLKPSNQRREAAHPERLFRFPHPSPGMPGPDPLPPKEGAAANFKPFPIRKNPPLPQPSPAAEGDLHQSASREGVRSGYLDACLNYTSRYARVLFGTESAWQRAYSQGYTDGQQAKREEREA
jgi:hypothetical protein